MKRIWLREARKRKGLTQAALAARIGKPQSYISKVESGFNDDPTFHDVLALARALDVDPLQLRFGQRESLAS